MAIDFDGQRWEKVKHDTALWWAGELGRPLIHVHLHERNPPNPKDATWYLGWKALFDPNVPAETIIDNWDYDLSLCRFMGDAFPVLWPNFGPGVIAAYMGANLEVGDGTHTVWFSPAHDLPIEEIHFEYDPDNAWLGRIKDIYRGAMERWQGSVQVGMTDLGGNLDILSTFRPAEKLLLDLYDQPEQVNRLTWDAHRMWWRYYEEFNDILRPVNPGYSAWDNVFSAQPYYILQCDFCYMVSPDMFDEFVKPELEATAKRLGHCIYHLDGIGQLAHLDSILEIEEIDGIQWIPGDGQPDITHWPDVHRKARDAGKLIQIYHSSPEGLEIIAKQLGTVSNVVFATSGDMSQKDDMEAFLKKYGA